MAWGNGYGMMGGYGYGYWGINSFLITILLVGLIILVYLWITRLWKENSGRAKK